MAAEAGIAGDGIRFMRALEAEAAAAGKPLPMNIDGALAAILHDMGFPPPAGNFIFIIGRVAGLTAGSRRRVRARKAHAHQHSGRVRRRAATRAPRDKGRLAGMAERTITAEEQQTCAELVQRARAAMAAIDALRPGHASIASVRAIALGRRQRGHRDAARQHERRRERHGQPRAEPPRQGAGHPARRAAAEEHGRHRGDAGARASSSTRSPPASSPR